MCFTTILKKRLDYLAKVMPSRTLHYKMPFPFLQLAKNLWVILPNCANIHFPNKVSHNDFSINREHSCSKVICILYSVCLYYQFDTQPHLIVGFPGGASGKDTVCLCRRHRNVGSIPGLGRSPGEGHGNPLQYSCLENPMDREVGEAKVHSITELDMTEVT